MIRSQQKIFSRYTKNLQPGELTWIGLRPSRKQPMQEASTAQAIEGYGLAGDHRCEKTKDSGRQVTIISEEYIQMISHFLGGQAVSAHQLRRNLVVKNINLTALRYQEFTIGSVVFQATALCHPCSRMESTLGKGAVAAMLGHGGLCAKIIQGGDISLGDLVRLS